ncbi:MAG: cysteine desulfurase IscS [Candidatus Paraimprobicoccus trichonymphae]|uniref:Cysteine desulfurase n=1 Tax=Candidatus Paraimprobicoccus trichonymphae TaxID=3033793 RepID=A0AA48I9D9_9FIRM|nr:MAG: cysteine desulfurase IscS [Candidatus Paraimprobicoccus trichonymphae]
MEKKIIYMDNAATTKVYKEVLEEMMPYYSENYGNASGIYSIGRDARKALENARVKVSEILNCDYKEIFFTSGGSESDNWAIKGVMSEQLKNNKNHVVTSKIEHHAILHTVEKLSKNGFYVTYLTVDKNGLINTEELEKSITERTGIVSIMYANNEIGTIQNISEIGEICKKKNVIFHTDAVQAVGNTKINFNDVDLLSMSGHKIHGPKGVGILFKKKNIRIQNLIDGGAQERNLRAGTENVAGIVGLSKALEMSYSSMDSKIEYLTELRNKLIYNLLKIEKSRLNGDLKKRLANNVNMCFEGIEGESILLLLDQNGICASSGSACTSGSLDPSHVLLALGLPHEIAHGSLRLTLSEENTEQEVDYVLDILPKIVQRLRNMSPIWKN